MIKKDKLLVLDLDGTLLNDRKEITPRTRECLKRAREKGYAVCYASGRSEEMMSIYRDAIGGCDYIVSNNGAMTRWLPGSEIVRKTCLRPEEVCGVLSYLLERQMHFMMYGSQGIYYSEYSEKLRQRVKNYEDLSARWGYPVRLPAFGVAVGDAGKEYPDVTKIVLYEEDETRMGAYMDYIRKEWPGLYLESTGYGLMGTFQTGVSKKSAVEAVIRHMQTDASRVYAFGDFDNDKSMFEAAGNRIAMGNAVDSLKEMATFVTGTNNEDGVAMYLEEKLHI